MPSLIPVFVDNSFIRESEKPYEFDTDVIGALALTPDNVARIRFLINNDSDYRPQRSSDEIDTVEKFCGNHPDFWNDVDLTTELVTIIDKTNSTHQASEGRGGGNKGREKTAKRICHLEDFENRLKRSDPTLVDDIADALDDRYTFSFASKFCTYVSRALLSHSVKQDGYSIYDLVVRKALPYYAATYLGEFGVKVVKRKGGYSKDPYGKFGDKKYKDNEDWKYKKYSDLIKRIIDANEEKIGYRISRRDFDNLLWYYYKGESSRLDKIQALVSKHGPEQLHKCFEDTDNCVTRTSNWVCDNFKYPVELYKELLSKGVFED